MSVAVSRSFSSLARTGSLKGASRLRRSSLAAAPPPSLPCARVGVAARPASTSTLMGSGLSSSGAQSAIMMPAMSPFMREGSIVEWCKKEGEPFAAGDVLLRIESDMYTVDVEALNPGYLGKILCPSGTQHIQVAQPVALVAKDADELANMYPRARVQVATRPRPPRIEVASHPHLSPAPRSATIERSSQPLHSAVLRSPPTTMETAGSVRAMSTSAHSVSPTAKSPAWTHHQRTLSESSASPQSQMDGLSLRRLIVSNLAAQKTSATSGDYFEGLL
ncbi:single hybrid motif-containing protein [Schizophyllum fasciatum]